VRALFAADGAEEVPASVVADDAGVLDRVAMVVALDRRDHGLGRIPAEVAGGKRGVRGARQRDERKNCDGEEVLHDGRDGRALGPKFKAQKKVGSARRAAVSAVAAVVSPANIHAGETPAEAGETPAPPLRLTCGSPWLRSARAVRRSGRRSR